jgi:hypothetical protein
VPLLRFAAMDREKIGPNRKAQVYNIAMFQSFRSQNSNSGEIPVIGRPIMRGIGILIFACFVSPAWSQSEIITFDAPCGATGAGQGTK